MTVTTNIISRDEIRDAMEMAGLEETAGTLNDTYSGRGMFGQTCMSFVIDGHWGITRRLARFFAVLASHQAYDLIEADTSAGGAPVQAEDLADVVELDHLGLDTIVYFPGWTLV